MKKTIFYIFGAGMVVIIGLLIAYGIVSWNASGRTYDNVNEIPHNKVGLLLGTSPFTRGGARNYYYDNRINSAEELYKAGKVDYIIASGGDYRKEHGYKYDEPQSIKDSLISRGIPEDIIILDYDGTRTLNSIVKAKEIYGLDSVTLISQKYHNERAIYLADKNGLYAVGYNAEPSPIRRNRIKNTIREIFARPKMFLDLMVENKPEFINKIIWRNTEIDSLIYLLSNINYNEGHLSKVEKALTMDREAYIILQIDSNLLYKLYPNTYDLNPQIKIRNKLVDDINSFIGSKMTEQWEMGILGTASSLIESRANLDLAVAFAVYNESMINDIYAFKIVDNYELLSESHLNSTLNYNKSKEQIILEINNYLDDYLIQNKYLDDLWHNEFTKYDEWQYNVTTQVFELKKTLQMFSENLNQFEIYNDIFQTWLFQQILEILKYGDS